MAKKKNEKLKTVKYQGLNVKLHSNTRSGPEAYFQLLRAVYEKDIVSQVGSEKAMTLRTQFVKNIGFKDVEHKILYGKLTRFTVLDGENWYNQKKHDFEKVEIPLNVFPNGYETDYCFIPSAHRFFVRIDPKVGLNAIEKFLADAIMRVRESDESTSVHRILSYDSIDQILNAPQLMYLKVNVSYTNDDIGQEAQELMDEMLKEGQIGDLTATIKPDQKGSLNTDSKLVKGLLEISRENGTAEATIRDTEGRRSKVITQDYPEKITVQDTSEDNFISKLFFTIMQKYRNG